MQQDSTTAEHRSRRHWWWLGAVWLLTMSAIATLGTITLGGTRIEHPLEVWEGATRFEHGWPWKYGERPWSARGVDNRWTAWKAMREFQPWALAGDVAVLAGGAVLIVLVARCMVRTPRLGFSLRQLAVGIALVAVACAYIAAHARAAQKERVLIERLAERHTGKDFYFYYYRDYAGPVWLSRLLGREDYLPSIFQRVSSLRIEAPEGDDPPQWEDSVQALGQLHHLRGLATGLSDMQLTQILRQRRTWPIESLAVNGHPPTSASLAEIGRCPRLKHIMLSWTQVDDEGIKHLLKCRRLERIDAEHTRITVASAATFAQMPRLQRLDIYRMQEFIHPEDFPAFRALGLKELYLDDYEK